MTYYFQNFKGYSTYRDFWFSLKETMKTAGWVVSCSGNGTTYNSTGDAIASSADFVTNSWISLIHPSLDGYQRCVCIQVGSDSSTIRLKIAWAGFPGTSATATRTPTYTDQRVIYGSGTDASPVYSQIFINSGSDAPYSAFIGVGDVTEKYSFYGFSVSQNNTSQQSLFGGGVNGIIGMQRVEDVHPLDIDPYIYIAGRNENSWNNMASSNSVFLSAFSYFNGIYKKGYSDEAITNYVCVALEDYIASQNYKTFVGYSPTSSWNNKFNLYPVILERRYTSAHSYTYIGTKGRLRDWYISPTPRSTLTTLSMNSNKDMIFLGAVLVVPWNGTNPLM